MSYGDAATRPRKGFKLVLLGDASVGKSSILMRFLHNKFSEEIAPWQPGIVGDLEMGEIFMDIPGCGYFHGGDDEPVGLSSFLDMMWEILGIVQTLGGHQMLVPSCCPCAKRGVFMNVNCDGLGPFFQL